MRKIIPFLLACGFMHSAIGDPSGLFSSALVNLENAEQKELEQGVHHLLPREKIEAGQQSLVFKAMAIAKRLGPTHANKLLAFVRDQSVSPDDYHFYADEQIRNINWTAGYQLPVHQVKVCKHQVRDSESTDSSILDHHIMKMISKSDDEREARQKIEAERQAKFKYIIVDQKGRVELPTYKLSELAKYHRDALGKIVMPHDSENAEAIKSLVEKQKEIAAKQAKPKPIVKPKSIPTTSPQAKVAVRIKPKENTSQLEYEYDSGAPEEVFLALKKEDR